MPRKRRLRVLADVRLQGNLCLRVAMYWICCQLAVALMLGCVSALQEPPGSSAQWLQRIWFQYGQAMGASLLVLPLVLLDCLVFSNRFAGPMRRLLVAMRQLADGQAVRPIEFRRGDYYWDLAREFNRILERMPASAEQKAAAKAALEMDCCDALAADCEPETAGVS